MKGLAQYLDEVGNRLDIEAIAAELLVAKLLKMSGTSFHFVDRQNKQGSDYYLEAILPNGFIAPCETKCKLEANDKSQKSIINSFSNMLKRKQLPENKPCIMFLILPSPWTTGERILNSTEEFSLEDDLSTILDGAIKNLFSRTTRVLEVIVLSNILMRVGQTSYVVTLTVKIGLYINSRSYFQMDILACW